MDKRIKPLQDGTAFYRTADAVQYVDSTPHDDTKHRIIRYYTFINLTLLESGSRVCRPAVGLACSLCGALLNN